MIRLTHLLVILFLPVLAAGHARAATLSTMNMNSAGYDLTTWNTWKAQAFHLAPSAIASTVVSVTLQLEIIAPNANLVARIVGSTSTPGRPDMMDVRGELRPAAQPAGTAVVPVTFVSDSSQSFPPLEADATYWLIVGMTAEDYDQSSPAGLIRWHYAGSHGQSPDGQAGWTVAPSIAASDTAGGDWISFSETPYLFSLTAVAVPEPGSCGLLLAAAAFFSRRRRA